MTVVLVDIGRYRVRFQSLDANGELDDASEKEFETDKYDGLAEVLAAYAKERRYKLTDIQLMIAGPGPIIGTSCRPVNMGRGWQFNARTLAEECGLKKVGLVHDMLAHAIGIPHLPEQDRVQIVGPKGWVQRADPNRPVISIAVGVGLGAACLVPVDPENGHWVPVSGEGGHVAFYGVTPDERRICDHLERAICPADVPLNAEMVLSSRNIGHLYEAALQKKTPFDSSESLLKAVAKGDTGARAVMTQYVRFLATFASNMALTFNAQGGVYISGGMAQILARDAAMAERFRDRFEVVESAYEAFLQSIPVFAVLGNRHALLGLKTLAGSMLED